MAGLAGAGRTEIARELFGADPHRGVVTLQGTHLRARHPADAVAASMAYVPEDRKNMGLFPAMSLRDNIIAAALPLASPAGLYREQIASDLAQSSRNQLRIVCRDIDQPVSLLSGGNQQKVILARWLITRPQVVIVDEPTHGIDVGAKYEIYQLLEQLAAKGTALLVISSELPELLGICSRILVIREGKIAGTLTGDRLTEQNIMSLAAV
jgi:ABC-type sugar transport system ATPase subunit